MWLSHFQPLLTGPPCHPLSLPTAPPTNHLPPSPSPSPCRPARFIKGDIQSADLVVHVLEAEQIDTVMHFAAQTHVDNSFGNSMAFTMNNTCVAVGWAGPNKTPMPCGHCRCMRAEPLSLAPHATFPGSTHAAFPPLPRPPWRSYGTHVLLECSRLYGKVRRFINVSTDEVYGESSLGREEGLNEGSPLEPTNPYSAAKVGALGGVHAPWLLLRDCLPPHVRSGCLAAFQHTHAVCIPRAGGC